MRVRLHPNRNIAVWTAYQAIGRRKDWPPSPQPARAEAGAETAKVENGLGLKRPDESSDPGRP